MTGRASLLSVIALTACAGAPAPANPAPVAAAASAPVPTTDLPVVPLPAPTASVEPAPAPEPAPTPDPSAKPGKKPVPSLRQGATQVNGRLPPEVIQRIVRQSYGKFRTCYENGLRTSPSLNGRVTVKFVISKDGDVTTATDGGSDLPDAAIVSCVVKAVTTLKFPKPEGGIVTVVYPLVLSPGE
jgi:hypothetical protein